MVSADKKLVGLLSLSELQHPDHPDSELVNKIMDSAPFKVVEHWPLVRAYQLFTCLGLRHLVVSCCHCASEVVELRIGRLCLNRMNQSE